MNWQTLTHNRALFLLVIALGAWRSVAQPGDVSCSAAAALGASDKPHVTFNSTHTLVCGNGTQAFDPTVSAEMAARYNTTRHLILQGVLLPSGLPEGWRSFTALRSVSINCGPADGHGAEAVNASSSTASANGAASGSGGAGNTTGGSTNVGNSSMLFGSPDQLESLHKFIEYKQGSALRSVSIHNCGMQGVYSTVWRTYLSGVPMVNLSGNALTGNLTATDDFDNVCRDDFAGDDYNDPDCSSSSLYILDVSRNALSGHIGTGAWLGDDVTDAFCSTGCLSLVLERGVTNPEVLCRAPLLLYALDNPGLVYRHGTKFASGYVTRDSSNWCFQPASRWVLPTMWGVFLALFFGTLGITLYARVRLKRLPFRMSTFDIMSRSTGTPTETLVSLGSVPKSRATGNVNGSSGGKLGSSSMAAAAASGRYVGLPDGGGAGAVEMLPVIPKAAGGMGSSSAGAVGGSGAVPYVHALTVTIPMSTAPGGAVATPADPAAAAVSPNGAGAAAAGSGGGSVVNGGVRPNRSKGSRSRKPDPNGMRAALTEGLTKSTDVEADSVGDMEAERYDESDLNGSVPLPSPVSTAAAAATAGGGAGGLTLSTRAAAAAAGIRITGGGFTLADDVGEGDIRGLWQRWWPVIRHVLGRALEILWMQLRTLLILGMFGLECYWAYSLILYRGGWQLLVLIPNYLENTLGGIAMLRAFMTGTHGRWKYVAPVPMLPFLMSPVYLVYGFLTYPFGWADLGPISWEKFVDLMDSCGVLSSTCWAIYSSVAYWRGNSVSTSYQFFNTDIFVLMMLMCFTDLLSTAHHLASTLQVPFKQWLRKEFDVRLIKIAPDKSHRLPGDGNI